MSNKNHPQQQILYEGKSLMHAWKVNCHEALHQISFQKGPFHLPKIVFNIAKVAFKALQRISNQKMHFVDQGIKVNDKESSEYLFIIHFLISKET